VTATRRPRRCAATQPHRHLLLTIAAAKLGVEPDPTDLELVGADPGRGD
jgi:hypothetical protein